MARKLLSFFGRPSLSFAPRRLLGGQDRRFPVAFVHRLAAPLCDTFFAGSADSPATVQGSLKMPALGSSGRSHSLNREKHSNLLIDVKTYKVRDYCVLGARRVG